MMNKPCYNSPWYVYIVECRDHTLYTGAAKDVKTRLKAHNRGQASRYSRSRLPVTLKYCEVLPTHSAALKREACIKGLTRREKLRLICCANVSGIGNSDTSEIE